MPATITESTRSRDGGVTAGEDLAGLDALDLPTGPSRRTGRLLWSATWPKLAAMGIGLLLWQLVVWSGWKPEYVLPGPVAVLSTLWGLVADGTVWGATAITMQRAALGYAIAVVVGTAIGSLVARVTPLRAAVGSLITGVQTMPSIAWFPLAILIFKLSEQAILFVVVLGAAPAVANGLIAGADNIPPLLMRAGTVLGARGLSTYRHIVLPGALPGFVAGLKQGWAFAWRSLMAGELIVVIADKQSIGSLLQTNRSLSDAEGLIAWMIVILVIGIVVDSALFGTLERAVRRRWGLQH